MKGTVLLLTPSIMREYLPAILELDHSIIADERWEQSHFLVDLPGKWECSRIVLDGEKLVGFMIVTFKAESVHVNRITIDPRYQGIGIATRLLQLAASCAQLNNKKFVTLKVSPKNRNAVGFYQHRGFHFREMSGSDLTLYIEVGVLLTAAESDRKT